MQSCRWSSYPLYLQPAAQRPLWLRVDRLLGEWGIPHDSPAGRDQFAGHIEARRRAEGRSDYTPHGWCLGSEAYRQELLAQVSQFARPEHRGPDIRESDQAKAEGIICTELQALGWTAADLPAHPKGAAAKLAIAARLRRETTMTLEPIPVGHFLIRKCLFFPCLHAYRDRLLAWIAARLHMGTPGHVSRLTYRQRSPRPNHNQAGPPGKGSP